MQAPWKKRHMEGILKAIWVLNLKLCAFGWIIHLPCQVLDLSYKVGYDNFVGLLEELHKLT